MTLEESSKTHEIKLSISSWFSKRKDVAQKLAVNNEEFIIALMMLCNLAPQKRIVLERWRCAIDVMIEKDKGPILGKLRLIELIEGDLQTLVRTHVGLRNDYNIKNDRTQIACVDDVDFY